MRDRTPESILTSFSPSPLPPTDFTTRVSLPASACRQQGYLQPRKVCSNGCIRTRATTGPPTATSSPSSSSSSPKA